MKRNLLLLTILALALTALAGNRSKETMLRLAKEQIAQQRVAMRRANADSQVKLIAERSKMSVYSDGEHFSIIGNDDRYDAVLAYGTGAFCVDSIPSNVKWWMTAVEQVMNSTSSTTVTAAQRAANSYTTVGPLMTTKWSQETPYNGLLPEVKNGKNKKSKAPCGCVATAMAQILNCNQYPSSVSFKGSYTIDGAEDATEEQVTETFSWPYLLAYGAYYPDGYTSSKDVKSISYTDEEGDAIARLIRACGYSVNMDYSYEGSGAYVYDAGLAMVEKFLYPQAAVKYLYRDYYTTEEWMDILYNEFKNGNPVLYGGCGTTSDSGSDDDYYGHAFVLHGMDSSGLVYVSWGWSGAYDGYYAVDLLHVDDETEFNLAQEMLIGIRPTALETDAICSILVTDEPYTISYSSKSSKLSVSLKSGLYNLSLYDLTGEVRFVVEDLTDNKNALTVQVMDDEVLESFYGWEADNFVSGKVSLTSGHTYRAYIESKDSRETDWQTVRTVGGPFYYEITYTEKGKATISDPVYANAKETTAIQSIVTDTDSNSDTTTRYFDLQGREVGNNARGLIVVKQGNTVKKVFK